MNGQAKITRVQQLPGEFALVHIALDRAMDGDIIYFNDLRLRVASLPTSDLSTRQFLCQSKQLPAAEVHHHVVVEQLPSTLFNLIIGHNNGIAAAINLAKRNRLQQPLVFIATDNDFPFTPVPSSILVPNLPDGVIAASPLLDDWGIASRLASIKPIAGCYTGDVFDLIAYLLTKTNKDFDICLAGSENFINNDKLGAIKNRYQIVKL